MLEFLDTSPRVDVAGPEYLRLLGYPPGLEPRERGADLIAWARQWYAENGRPWMYAREAALEFAPDALRFDDVPFASAKLQQYLQRSQATRVMLVAVGAGRECEQYAHELWQQERPDEYFFLEIFGSAVVEHLMAAMSGRLCDLAERDGHIAIRPFSPGYAGWDIAEQPALFELITRGSSRDKALPESVEVLTSGMLRPKKTQLAVFGLTARTAASGQAAHFVPCDRCSFHPCQYRRRPYRHSRTLGAAASSATHPAPAPVSSSP